MRTNEERVAWLTGVLEERDTLRAENEKLRQSLQAIADGRGYATDEEPWEVREARRVLSEIMIRESTAAANSKNLRS